VYFQAPLFYELTKSSRKREGNTRLHDGVSRFLPLLSLEKGRNLHQQESLFFPLFFSLFGEKRKKSMPLVGTGDNMKTNKSSFVFIIIPVPRDLCEKGSGDRRLVSSLSSWLTAVSIFYFSRSLGKETQLSGEKQETLAR
jgi:hypothetical protein